jgi:hypothetical protein
MDTKSEEKTSPNELLAETDIMTQRQSNSSEMTYVEAGCPELADHVAQEGHAAPNTHKK